jgi:hypothetical protein
LGIEKIRWSRLSAAKIAKAKRNGAGRASSNRGIHIFRNAGAEVQTEKRCRATRENGASLRRCETT